MSASPDPFGRLASVSGDTGYDAAAQEFAAGAHPISKELVLRTDGGARMLVVAVDPRRQRRLGELFAGSRPGPSVPWFSCSAPRRCRGPVAGSLSLALMFVIV